jgi:hypothetical protein
MDLPDPEEDAAASAQDEAKEGAHDCAPCEHVIPKVLAVSLRRLVEAESKRKIRVEGHARDAVLGRGEEVGVVADGSDRQAPAVSVLPSGGSSSSARRI